MHHILKNKESFSTKFALTFAFWILIYFSITLLNGVRSNANNVPFWDEWNSKLMMNPETGPISWNNFWIQSNEHRLVIAKAFFYLDFVFFNGDSLPLVLLNVALTILIIILASIKFFDSKLTLKSKVLLVSLSVSLLFSLTNYENLFWGFQIQFYLSLFIPLVAFHFYAQYEKTGDVRHLIASLMLGFVSIGTMASGLMALPSILIMQMIRRKSFKILLPTFSLIICSILLYFSNFESTPANPISILFSDPEFFLKYNVLLVGSLVYQFAGQSFFLSSAFFCVCLFYFLRGLIIVNSNKVNPKKIPLIFPLLVCIYFSAFGTLASTGRQQLGEFQSLSSRYLIFSSIFIINVFFVAFIVHRENQVMTRFITISAIATTLFMIPIQSSNANVLSVVNFNRELAAVALNLGVDDETQIRNVVWDPNLAQVRSLDLIENSQSIFSSPFYRKSRQDFNWYIEDTPDMCQGNLDVTSLIPGNLFKVKFEGWLYAQDLPNYRYIIAVDESNIALGFGVHGQPRPDVVSVKGKKYENSGFVGYSRASKIDRLLLVDENLKARCQVIGD